jgi:hypothetical protein
MTLVARLFLAGLLGVALFFGYLFWGEPKLRSMAAQEAVEQASPGVTVTTISSVYGQYQAIAPKGRYVLVLDANGAEMRYTDKRNKVFAYRGHYTVDGSTLIVDWAEQRAGTAWTPMKTIVDRMTIATLDAIDAPQRPFKRVVNTKAKKT